MVAAGVYMLCRVFFIFTPGALTVIAWIGGFTALLAALIAVQQNDIKRILAYSTLSQLGYMVMAVGLTAPDAGMFHLTTHAFFKALLFLGAGSVIIALHHEQDIWRMGARKGCGDVLDVYGRHTRWRASAIEWFLRKTPSSPPRNITPLCLPAWPF
jgi:NADH:ubiquinone oxidoreductase subunit 5 (subunit L)/multisubunit Na+/H+ antiporter MnhA subunit